MRQRRGTGIVHGRGLQKPAPDEGSARVRLRPRRRWAAHRRRRCANIQAAANVFRSPARAVTNTAGLTLVGILAKKPAGTSQPTNHRAIGQLEQGAAPRWTQVARVIGAIRPLGGRPNKRKLANTPPMHGAKRLVHCVLSVWSRRSSRAAGCCACAVDLDLPWTAGSGAPRSAAMGHEVTDRSGFSANFAALGGTVSLFQPAASAQSAEESRPVAGLSFASPCVRGGVQAISAECRIDIRHPRCRTAAPNHRKSCHDERSHFAI